MRRKREREEREGKKEEDEESDVHSGTSSGEEEESSNGSAQRKLRHIQCRHFVKAQQKKYRDGQPVSEQANPNNFAPNFARTGTLARVAIQARRWKTEQRMETPLLRAWEPRHPLFQV